MTRGMTPLLMVVDDDVEIRAGICAILASGGYRVAHAENGADALDQLRGGLRPWLMLVDVHMPVMDGPTFCGACRADEDFAGIPVMVMSADPAALRRAERDGTGEVMAKPMRGSALIERIAKKLEDELFDLDA